MSRNLCKQVATRLQHYSSSVGTGTSQAEIHQFSQLASTWWDTRGSQRILHKMNLSRMDFIRDQLRNQVSIPDASGHDIFIPGYDYKQFYPEVASKAIEQDVDKYIDTELMQNKLHVLDVGCGGGILAESMGRLPFVASVTGIDLTPEVIEVAKEHAELDPLLENKVQYKVQSVDEVEGQFDVVTCFEMLEHVDEPGQILKHTWSKVKKGGLLFLSTINQDPISWVTTILVAENVLHLVPKGTHHWSKFVNLADVIDWFNKRQKHKFTVLSKKGVMYIPTVGWRQHDCSNVGNYFLCVRKR